ncbi:autotransporter outer membrane beta-barrel domain-containing protein [Bartonella heixiaziensis]|uniref:autotransporter outer membrane beta-barrel domain-containing protein n=1 Tax=Bartonella heixiaziensis TaxID=1461000 RepID=UPI003908AB93
MINVFKNRTRLYALTTSAFFFLQGVDVSMGNSWLPSFSVLSFPSFSSSGLSSLSSYFGSGSSITTSPSNPSSSGGSPSLSSGGSLPSSSDGSLSSSDPSSPPSTPSLQGVGGGTLDSSGLQLPRVDGSVQGGVVQGQSISSQSQPALETGKMMSACYSTGNVFVNVPDTAPNGGGANGRVPGAAEVPGGVAGAPGGGAGTPGGGAEVASGDVSSGSQSVQGSAQDNGDGVQNRAARSAVPAPTPALPDNIGGELLALVNQKQLYGPISCDRAGAYTVAGGTIAVSQGEAAVYVNGDDLSDGKKIAVNLEQMSIIYANNREVVGDSLFQMGPGHILNFSAPSSDLDGAVEGTVKNNKSGHGLSAVQVSGHAKVDLVDSNIQGFLIGLEATNGGEINMRGGAIRDTYLGVAAVSGGEVFLENVNINARKVGLYGSISSVIGMKDGVITVAERGIGAVSGTGGTVQLDGTTVSAFRVAKAQKTVEVSEREESGEEDSIKSIGLWSRGGTLSFKNGRFGGSDTVVLMLGDDFLSDEVQRFLTEGEGNGSAGAISIEEGVLDIVHSKSDAIYNDVLGAYMEATSIIEENSNLVPKVIVEDSARSKRSGDSEPSAGVVENFRFTNLIVSNIQSSGIKAEGNSYGIYFYEPDKKRHVRDASQNSVNAGVRTYEAGVHAVLVKNSTLRVPDGIAVYGDSFGGYVVVKDESTLSGGLLLKAEHGSDLSVLVNDSTIVGAAHIDKDSHARIFLSGGSEWHLTESVYRGSQHSNAGCADSCVSSIKLKDSAIRFFSSSRSGNNQERGDSNQYRTLRIGKGYKKGDKNGMVPVYSADGASSIYLNANLMPRNTGVAQVSDRVLIHGNVEGETMVYVQDTSEGTQQNQHSLYKDGNIPYSVSIIQVFGEAKRDSFKLKGDYITREGLPYKYVLRAYGPTMPPKMQYFDKKLIQGSSTVWDFRLENDYVVPLVPGYTTANNFTINVPQAIPQDRTKGADGGKNKGKVGDVPGKEGDGAPVVPPLPTPPNGDTPAGSPPSEDVLGSLGGVDGGSEMVENLPSGSAPSTVSGGVSSTGLGRSDTSEGEMSPASELGENENAGVDGYVPYYPSFDNSGLYEEGLLEGATGEYVFSTESFPDFVLIKKPDGTIVKFEVTKDVTDEGVYIGLPDGLAIEPDGSIRITEGVTKLPDGTFRAADGDIIMFSNPTSYARFVVHGRSEDSEGIGIVEEIDEDSEEMNEESGEEESRGIDVVSSSVASTASSSGGSVSEEPSASSPPARSDEAVNTVTLSSGSSTVPGVSNASRNSASVTPVTSAVSVTKAPAPTAPAPTAPVRRILSAASGEVTSSTASGEVTSSATSGKVTSSATSGKVASSAASGRVDSSSTLGRSELSSVPSVKNAGVKAVSSQCNDTAGNGTGGLSVPYSCSDGKSHTMKNITLKASNNTQHPVHAKGGNTVINLEATTISSADSSESKNNVDLTRPVSAVLAEEGAEVVLSQKSTVKSSMIGLEAQRGGKVKVIGGTVNTRYVGALAGSGSSVDLASTNITVEGDSAAAGLASDGGKIAMSSGNIALSEGVAVRSETGGSITLNKVGIVAKKQSQQSGVPERFGRAAFLLSDNSSVDFTEGSVVTDANGLWIRDNGNTVKTDAFRRKRSSDVRPSMNRANIEFSTVRVEGDRSYGIYFDGTAQKTAGGRNQVVNGNSARKTRSVERSTVPLQKKTPIGIMGTVSLKRTDFEVLKNIAVYGNNSGGRVFLENRTTLSGDLLLKAENNSNISLSVDNSIIAGGARVDESSYAQLDLTNRSEWLLKRSMHQGLQALDLKCMDSCVSSVNLVNSSIEFVPSESEDLGYQTLRIGEGRGIVYSASGNASIFLNARLNPHDSREDQMADRLLIHGDVSGKTIVHVRGVSDDSVAKDKADVKKAHSVSIIQVYGKAEKDSFRLDGDYVALGNSPYKYTLRSYGPEMTSKEEHVQQRFMKDGGAFWNFRLENQYVKSGGFDANVVSMVESSSHSERGVRSVVPQVPTYLTLPNSILHAGLMDISNQNKQLEILRTTFNGMVEIRENPALYLRGYGGSYRYASDLSVIEYGYGGDLSYNGVEAGILLQTIESADIAMSFGAMGSYGKLSLQPVDVEQSQKSAFDKWTATVYGSMQHDAGFYVDGLLSYGLLKGDVVTLARGKTATLKGNPLSVSLTGGQSFATGYEGFVLDPQVQVVYQHLQFSKARDIDHFDIEMGKLDQWVARVGGRLIKTPTGSEGMNAVAFYGKLHFVHGFGEKQTVRFKDSFQLGAFGSSLEAGLGFNAKLSSQFSLYGDLVYQHKLTKAGFSGTSFSGGLRYQF